MIVDLIRAFIEAIVIRELALDLPVGSRVEKLNWYLNGVWSVEWSVP